MIESRRLTDHFGWASVSKIQKQQRIALAHAMIREFGDRAADVAHIEHAKAIGDAAESWGKITVLIERKVAKRRFHAERRDHVIGMANAAASPEIRAIHLELARMHAARARSA